MGDRGVGAAGSDKAARSIPIFNVFNVVLKGSRLELALEGSWETVRDCAEESMTSCSGKSSCKGPKVV